MVIQVGKDEIEIEAPVFKTEVHQNMRYETQCMRLFGKVDIGFDTGNERPNCILYFSLSKMCLRVSQDLNGTWSLNETTAGCFGAENS